MQSTYETLTREQIRDAHVRSLQARLSAARQDLERANSYTRADRQADVDCYERQIARLMA